MRQPIRASAMTSLHLQETASTKLPEIAFIDQIAKRPAARSVAFLYLNSFSASSTSSGSPKSLRSFEITSFGAGSSARPKLSELVRFENSGGTTAAGNALRRYHDVRPIDRQGQVLVATRRRNAADSRHVVADIINVLLEELVHHRYISAFSTLERIGYQYASELTTRILQASLDNSISRSNR